MKMFFVIPFAVAIAAIASAQPTQQAFKLLADDGAVEDIFGNSVAISGSTAIIGAYGDGAAYLFDVQTGQQLFKLLGDDTDTTGRFGISVAISGSTAIVGSDGSAYLFDTETGQKLFKLLGGDTDERARFGTSVAISDSTAVVGTSFDDDNGSDSGSAYLFDAQTGQQIAKVLPDDGAAFDHFGASVAISGTIAVISAIYDGDSGDDSGSAHIFGPTCPGDCDLNSRVDFNDLVTMLFKFGNDTGDACDADGSGTVNFNDLVTALFVFGPCP